MASKNNTGDFLVVNTSTTLLVFAELTTKLVK